MFLPLLCGKGKHFQTKSRLLVIIFQSTEIASFCHEILVTFTKNPNNFYGNNFALVSGHFSVVSFLDKVNLHNYAANAIRWYINLNIFYLETVQFYLDH